MLIIKKEVNMEKIFMLLRKENEIDFTKLISKHFDVEIFTDVILGLQTIKKLKPSLIIIDLATSRISGIELIRILRSNPTNYHIKIIVTAKNFNFKALENAFTIGADYFVKYPFNIEDVEKIYSNIIDVNNYTNLESIATNYDWVIGI
jgi:DNA-binding response OmpR family regulator